ncbi:hypothetical protein Ddc_07471 [Ditylenchus destructor]|nr:hypothetical protein Ddc_07471 [Ditylenchus destructor]
MSFIMLKTVLQNFDRDELEILTLVSQRIERIIYKHFPMKPFRVCGSFEIRVNPNGHLDVCLRNGQFHLRADRSNVVEFKSSTGYVTQEILSGFFSIHEMSRFLGETVRFKTSIIWISPDARINPEHIAAMEEMTHLWSDRCLVITPQPHLIYERDTLPTLTLDYHLILSSPMISHTCRILRIYGIDMPLSQYHNFYGVKIIKIALAMTRISLPNFLDFIEGIKQHKSDAIICFEFISISSQIELSNHISKIRETFPEDRAAFAYKVNFLDFMKQVAVFDEFKDKNPNTHETLRMRVISGKEKENFCSSIKIHVSDATVFALERQLT